MNPAPMSRLAVVILTAAVLWLYFTHRLFATGASLISLQVAAGMLMLWARLTFGWRSFHGLATTTEGSLVTTGPYRYVRNPIYSAILLFMWAGIAAHPGMVSAALATVATVAIGVRIATEEALLIQRYPEYAAYAARTRRLIPGLF